MRTMLVLATFVLLVPAAAGKAPPTPRETAVILTGRAPCGLTTHRGELWVGVYEAGTVLRLDRTGGIRQRLRVGRYACQLAVDDAAVWVTRDNANRMVRIDRRSGRVRAVRIRSPFGLERAAGALWVTSFETGTVARVDPMTARVRRILRIGGNPVGIAACAGALWVGHGREATWLTRVDPRTGAARRIDVGVRSPRAPSCIRGQLWVATEDDVLRVAPRSGKLLAHIRLEGTRGNLAEAPAGVSASRLLWVTDKERSLIHRIEPGSGRVVDEFPAGPAAFDVVALGSSMWVTSYAGADVRRYDP
jgi:streptogramin lyase